jgi:hypothetical protein
MRIQKSLIEDTISTKKAGLLLYSMQLALTNVGQTTFGQAKDEEMVRETMDEEGAFSEEALSSQHSVVSEKQNQRQKQRPFTAKDAEDAKESKENQHQNQMPFTTDDTEDAEKNQGLPRMNTDDTDFGEAGGEEGGGDVEFVMSWDEMGDQGRGGSIGDRKTKPYRRFTVTGRDHAGVADRRKSRPGGRE